MGGATRAFYLEVLAESLGILREARADHVVIGGVATDALLERPLRHDEDIDVLIRPEDAQRLLDVFARAGYSTHRRDEGWIYKAARPDVTVDLIFRSGETVLLDSEHLARSRVVEADGVAMSVPAPEDLAVMKAVFDGGDRPARWYGALALLARFPVDWRYLVERGRAEAPRRILSLLLYAADDGVDVPDDAIEMLAGTAIGPVQHAGLR